MLKGAMRSRSAACAVWASSLRLLGVVQLKIVLTVMLVSILVENVILILLM